MSLRSVCVPLLFRMNFSSLGKSKNKLNLPLILSQELSFLAMNDKLAKFRTVVSNELVILNLIFFGAHAFHLTKYWFYAFIGMITNNANEEQVQLVNLEKFKIQHMITLPFVCRLQEVTNFSFCHRLNNLKYFAFFRNF